MSRGPRIAVKKKVEIPGAGQYNYDWSGQRIFVTGGSRVNTGKKDPTLITREFRARQTRQIIAIAAALFLVMLSAVLYKRPVLVELSKSILFGGQIAVITAFLAFSAFNWRCPACGNFLGGDIHRRKCNKCRAVLS